MGLKTKYNTSRGDTWYELFYDLIFVSAAVQIGHMVQADITFEGMVYAGLLFAVMRATWDELMFYQNRFDTPDMVHYSFYLIQAMCAFTMAGHLTVEGHSGTWDKDRNLEPFVIAAALARITQSIFYYQVIRLTEAYYNHFFIMAMSQALSGLIYLGPILFPRGWDYYYLYFFVALVVERSFTNIAIKFFTNPKTTYVAPWHMGHMIHREVRLCAYACIVFIVTYSVCVLGTCVSH
jgi:low temperature requirement protein LtrA